jgi:hypothetical protein
VRPLQRLHDVVCGLQPIVRVLGQTGPDHTLEIRRRHWLQARHRRGIPLEDRGDQAGSGVAGKRPLARCHLVEDCAEGEKIRASVRALSLNLLGRHVGQRSEYPTLAG